MQQKDIIYIDVEDDITSIIGKVKKSKQKIVALVPPKRTGILQSAVNMRLLARTAENADKQLVIISNSAALASLAAAADIPIAKNLQSKPQLVDTSNDSEPEADVIDGGQIPVGEHADAAESSLAKDSDVSIDGIDIDGEKIPTRPMNHATDAASDQKQPSKKAIKVPDFGSFRKRLTLGAVGTVFLAVFLYWALAIAPQATVVLSARTTDQVLSVPVTLGQDLLTSVDQATIRSVKLTEKDIRSVDFSATGTKDVGEKAKGEVTFSTDSATLIAQNATIPAGTNLISSSGLVFITTSSVTFSLSNFSGVKAGIVAAASGTKYNGISGGLTGAPSKVSAQITESTSGGTEKIIKVVSQEDVDKAKEQLAESNKDSIKKKLKDKFPDNSIVISDSFFVSDDKSTSAPAVGQEATDGKAKLSSETTYTMVAVSKEEIDPYLDSSFEKILSNKNIQRVYDNGLATVKFEDFKSGEKSDTVTILATAKIGPKIDEETIKQDVKGKRSGEVIGDLKDIDGISDVQVKLSPFWVQGIPGDIKKITIEFKLKNDG